MSTGSAFLATLGEERLRARRELDAARVAGDESGRTAALGRLADLEEILRRSTEPLLSPDVAAGPRG